MQCFIYKSLKTDELYLYLSRKDDFSVVPDALLKGMGQTAFVMELVLTPERRLAREDVKAVMAALASNGYFVQLPPSREARSGTLQ